ncbi:MAG: peptide-methionine (S)-S-oxide reductase MsrA [Pseudomonadota bacterium]|nr:peptide-methionine (S)-S-oxide reductase MsrA [Pseudomonadota bacterium]
MMLALLLVVAPLQAAQTETAIFAGGCFWCTESDFDKVPGVVSTTSGYIGGHQQNPTYQQVSAGGSGHTEAVQVVYDPTQVSYARLLDKFWHSIDPTTPDAQFCDHGSQYRSAIFYLNSEQRQLAEASKVALEKNKPFKQSIVTQIVAASTFYPAEAYHQNYHERNSVRYNYYRWSCGRDQRLEELWGKK